AENTSERHDPRGDAGAPTARAKFFGAGDPAVPEAHRAARAVAAKRLVADVAQLAELHRDVRLEARTAVLTDGLAGIVDHAIANRHRGRCVDLPELVLRVHTGDVGDSHR